MIKLIWAIVAIIIVCVVFLIRRGMKGPAHTLESISKPINDLLVRGCDGGFLIIDASGTNYFIQLRKYIKSPMNYGIELSFPKAEWSKEFFPQLITFFEQHNMDYEISKSRSQEKSLVPYSRISVIKNKKSGNCFEIEGLK